MKPTHIITISYTASAELIDLIRPKHREFLDRGYAQGLFIASGPNSAQNGGVILASGELGVIKALLQEDPFLVENVATYSYHSFSPVKHAEAYAAFI